jgi:hypothetical protein
MCRTRYEQESALVDHKLVQYRQREGKRGGQGAISGQKSVIKVVRGY